MQALKKVLVSVVMVASMAAVSSSALAAPKGEEAVKEAIENTLSGIATAQKAVKGGDLSTASKDILDASQASKAARKALDSGDTAGAEAGLESALKSFSEMKAKYDLTH